MRLFVTVIAAASIAASTAANAKISITESQYAGGVLVVRGRTSQAQQTVTLDELFSETSDAAGRFTFRIRYLPHNCKVELKSGIDEYSVLIANCFNDQPVTTKPALRGQSGD